MPRSLPVERRPGAVGVALHFAGTSTPCLQWAGDSDFGSPWSAGAPADVSSVPWRHFDGGDHALWRGEAHEARIHDGSPLLFHTGKFRHTGGNHDLLIRDDPADGSGGVPWFSSVGS